MDFDPDAVSKYNENKDRHTRKPSQLSTIRSEAASHH